jgi:hypothetical protein
VHGEIPASRKIVNAYELDIRRALDVEFDSEHLIAIGAAMEIYSLLNEAYPSGGSKIDWERVPSSVRCIEDDGLEAADRFLKFFDEMCSRFKLSGPVIYVGDSLTTFALAGSIETIRRISPVLIEVPQHHYFVGPNASWCICLTMEGDLDFGTSGKSALG